MTTSMNNIEFERRVEPFNGISSSHGIDIQYTQSNEYSVIIKAKAKLVEQIETVVESGVLKISWQNGLRGFFKAKFLRHSAVVVYVSAPSLKIVNLSTGVDLYAETIKSKGELALNISNGSGLKAKLIDADSISICVSQSSGVEIEAVKSSKITVENTAHSDVELCNIDADSLDVKASGFSDTELTGTVNRVSITAESSSDTDIKRLRCDTVDISKSKGSSVYK